MRIIKLQVEQNSDRGIKVVKYAVGLDIKKHHKIGRFVIYVKKVCKLDDLDYQLEIDGFVMSKHDRTKALKQEVVYRLKIEQNSRKDEQIRPSRIQQSEEEVVQNKPKKAIVDKKSKNTQKIQKIVRKKKKQISSESESSSSSSSSSQSSSSSSQSEAKPKKKIKNSIKSANKQSSSDEQQVAKTQQKRQKLQTPKKSIAKPAPLPTLAAKKRHYTPSVSSGSISSSESQQQLPQLLQRKAAIATAKINPNTNQQVKPKPPVTLVNSQKRAMINDESSSESQPSQYHPQKQTMPQKTNNTKPQSPAPSLNKPKNDIKLPPALRNKQLPKKNFDQHKENQWINIDKQKMKKWKDLGHSNVCQANNKIRFKIIELDEEKFIPVKSGWINAQVKDVQSNGVVNLVKVEQEGKPYRQNFAIPQHNMDELQISRLLATKQQLECFEQKQQTAEKQVQKQVEQIRPVQTVDNSNDKNSVEKFVCGQVNYYFSDKNYNFDLFTQMHANRHPQKYVNFSLLLNFPKIKKVVRDQQKIIDYLRGDQKYEQRNYEIDFQRRLIRKKGVFKPQNQGQKPVKAEQSNENKSTVEQKQVQIGQISAQ